MAVTHFGNTWISDNASDTITATEASENIYGNAGTDTLKGMGGHDSIQGGLGNDVLIGGDGNDYLIDLGSIAGLSGNELVGKDKLNGGKGNDTLLFQSSDGGDIGDGGDGIDTIFIDYSFTSFSQNTSISFHLFGGGSAVLIDDLLAAFVQNCEKLIFIAGAYNDIITGGKLDDRLYGAGGNDVLKGMDGNDLIDGGSGRQNLDGGDGIDTLAFDLSEASDDLTLEMSKTITLSTFGTAKNFERFGTIHTGDGADKITNTDKDGAIFYTHGGADDFKGGKGKDTWYMGTGADIGNLGDGDDIAYIEKFEQFDTASKVVHGGAGNDKMIGAAGADSFYGDAGDDNINSGKGADVIEGGAGNDKLAGGDGADHLIGGDGNDSLEADRDYTGLNTAISYNVDILEGGAGDDGLQGGFGADILNGGDDNDFVSLDFWDGTSTPDSAKDTADGGNGRDTLALYIPLDWNLTLTLSSTMTVTLKGIDVATANNFEILRVNATGTGNLTLTGGAFDDYFWTGSGNDMLDGLGGNDFLYASNGSDTVFGGEGDDRIDTMIDGDDVVDAGKGNDLVIVRQLRNGATAGNSTYDAGEGIDTLSLEAGATDLALVGDEIKIGGTTVATVTNWEILNFYGSSLGSTVTGATRDDIFTLLSANDVADGGKGNDQFIDYGGLNEFDGGEGNDTVNYSNQSAPISVTLNGENEVTVQKNGAAGDKITSIENVTGSRGADSLTGDDNANILNGSSGSDTIKGMGGADKLSSGVGKDILIGGKGADQFIYSGAFESSPQTFWEIDEIRGFERGIDDLNFRTFDANFQKTGLQHFALLNGEGAKFSGQAGQLRFDRRNGDTYVEGDTDGDKVADLIIILDGNIGLTKADFML